MFWILYISFYVLIKYIFIFFTKQTQHTLRNKPLETFEIIQMPLLVLDSWQHK